MRVQNVANNPWDTHGVSLDGLVANGTLSAHADRQRLPNNGNRLIFRPTCGDLP